MDKATIAKVQGFGFDVYMRDPDDTYLFFTDGTRIGYLQEERFGGYSLSTVHVPNRTSGTGYKIVERIDDFDKASLEKAFAFAPDWAGSESRGSVKKWKNMEAFLAANRFNAGYQLVPAA